MPELRSLLDAVATMGGTPTTRCIAFLLSFVLILAYSLKHLQVLIAKEELLEKHEENTGSRTSEIITNIKTVKSFATEAQEYQRQQQRFEREFK